MAKFVLKDAFVEIEDYTSDGETLSGSPVDLSDHVQSLTISIETDTPEATAMGDLDRVRLYGLREWSAEITFFQDFASGSVDETIWDVISNQKFVQLRFRKDLNTTVGPQNPEYSGRAVLPQHNPLAGSIGEVSTITINFQSSGQITRSTS